MTQRKFQFYIVPTPIGNIKDITIRALEILNEVDLIACEDTRITQKLLNHYDIKTNCISYHKYNEKERVEKFIEELKSGKSIALVSDAGTPMICDPGMILTDALLKEGITINALPGACAITTFLSQIPRKTECFTFIGFLPRSENQMKEIIKKYLKTNIVFYDAPERILKNLKLIYKNFGNLKISLGRELTKLYEENITANISNILEYYNDGIKGEIVCMIHANENENDLNLEYKINDLMTKGFKDKEISVILSTLYNSNKNEVYQKILQIKHNANRIKK